MILSWINVDPYWLYTPPPYRAVFKKKTHEVACKVLPVPWTRMDPPNQTVLPPVSFNHFSVSVRLNLTKKCRLSPLVLAVIVVNAEFPVRVISLVNETPALVIVQSLVHVKVPSVSGDAAAQLHSTDKVRSKQTNNSTMTRKKLRTRRMASSSFLSKRTQRFLWAQNSGRVSWSGVPQSQGKRVCNTIAAVTYNDREDLWRQ